MNTTERPTFAQKLAAYRAAVQATKEMRRNPTNSCTLIKWHATLNRAHRTFGTEGTDPATTRAWFRLNHSILSAA